MNDIQKVMLELLAMERYWEFQENINYEECDWKIVNSFLNHYTDSVRYTKDKEVYFDDSDVDTYKAIYNQGYINGVRFAINSLRNRFDNLDNLELPKELIDSETSDVLFEGSVGIHNYIETEQLFRDIEEEE